MEEAVIRLFEEALDDPNIPFELILALRRQYGEIRLAMDRLHSLERPVAAEPPTVVLPV